MYLFRSIWVFMIVIIEFDSLSNIIFQNSKKEFEIFVFSLISSDRGYYTSVRVLNLFYPVSIPFFPTTLERLFDPSDTLWQITSEIISGPTHELAPSYHIRLSNPSPVVPTWCLTFFKIYFPQSNCPNFTLNFDSTFLIFSLSFPLT